MGVLNVLWPQTGLVPNTTSTTAATTLPTFIYIQTDNTLDEVLVSNYLNQSRAVYGNIYSNSQMALVYTTDSGPVLLRVLITGSGNQLTYSLQSPAEGTGIFNKVQVEDGTAALPSYTFVSDLDSGFYRIGSGNIGLSLNGSLVGNFSTSSLVYGGGVYAGLSGTAGTLRSYPATAANGYLELFGTANGGARNVTITNAAHGQTTAYTIPDVGAATGGILVSTTPLRSKTVVGAAAAGGAAAQSFTDAFCTSSSRVSGNWVTQANPASILTIVPGNGSFVVTSSADAGVGTFSYTIYKA